MTTSNNAAEFRHGDACRRTLESDQVRRALGATERALAVDRIGQTMIGRALARASGCIQCGRPCSGPYCSERCETLAEAAAWEDI